MFNIIRIAIIALISFTNFSTQSSTPWNKNTREHLFGYVDECFDANCKRKHCKICNDNQICNIEKYSQGHRYYHVPTLTIEDEGFRWRNSLNFTVNG